MKILLCKNSFGHFVPVYDSDFELAKKIKTGEIKAVTFSNPRSLQFHKKFFAMIKLVFENQNRYTSQEGILIELKLRLKWYDLHVSIDGKETLVPRSISFEKMEQHEFEKFYLDSVNCILQSGLIQINKEEIEENIINYF